MNDAGHRQNLSAGCVSFVGVAPVAGHTAHKTIFLLWPNGGLEGQTLLGCEALSVVRKVLFDAHACHEEQAHQQALLYESHRQLIIISKK